MIALLLAACTQAPSLTVQRRPVDYGAERIQATRAYIERHYGPEWLRGPDGVQLTPTAIVVHGTSDPDLETAWSSFAAPTLSDAKAHLRPAGIVNVGVHYLVDRDGSAYALIDEDRVGRHCAGLNHTALAIENVGDGPGGRLTEAQLATTAALVRDIAGRHEIDWLIGHHEALWLEGVALFHELDPTYRPYALDPGAAFMDRLEARVGDLGLRRVPVPIAD